MATELGPDPAGKGESATGVRTPFFIDLITGDVVSELVRYVDESAGWIYCDGNGLGPGAER